MRLGIFQELIYLLKSAQMKFSPHRQILIIYLAFMSIDVYSWKKLWYGAYFREK